MKKPLLLGLSIAMTLSISAQSSFRKMPANAPVKKAKTFIKNIIDASDAKFPKKNYAPLANNNAKMTAPPYKKVSSSHNLLSVLVSQSNPLNYNKDLNAVSYVHRQSFDWVFTGSNSGNQQISWTTNNGTTWDTLVHGLCNGAGVRYRYPSGAIFNPTGNTNIANAFVVGSGPITDGSNWVGNYYVSGQLNGTNKDSQDMLNGAGPWPTHHFARIDFDMVNGQAKVASSLLADPAATTVAGQAYRGMAVATGTFNAGNNAFDWTFDTLNVTANAQVDGAGDAYLNTLGYHAWSDNGQTGYYVWFGVDVASTAIGARSYQPIVFKTTNGGTSWAQYMPGFDWSTVPTMQQYLFSYDGTNLKAFFSTGNGNDMAVDANGDLHIACQILSATSDDQDSLGYIFSVQPNYIYDAYTTSGGWNASLIDSISANASNGEATTVWSDQSTSPPTAYDNDARLQISKSVNGDKLFFEWVDTDISQVTDPINIQPSLYAKGVDVNTRCWTAVKPYYASTDYAYYHYTCQRAVSPTATTYLIPTTYINSADGSFNAINPIAHYYVDDVTFADADFSICPVGVAENEAMLSAINVYPNPTNGSATLSVKVKEANEISVNLYNTIGQLVITKKVKGEVGVNKINLATENLASGIYFYEVKVADFTISNKLMIQK
ncbi:MAG: T9SS type A sorting domain-containing protein [Bacteroidia bacterium]|nr:T9SS type A sorting domain-containing protein [Bacteroidia bacterium]